MFPRPFAAVLLAANTPTPSGTIYTDPAPRPTLPIPVFDTSGNRVGAVDTLSWYHHLLVAHGTTSLPATLHPTSAEALVVGPPAEPGLEHLLTHWQVAAVVAAPDTSHGDPHARMAVSRTPTATPPLSAYEASWRLSPLRVATHGDRHGSLRLSLGSTAPTPPEERLLALYAHYRIATATPTRSPDPLLLADPSLAENDPLVLNRNHEGTWHYARTSWGPITFPSRTGLTGRTLVQVLQVVEDADGTPQAWYRYQLRHTAPSHA